MTTQDVDVIKMTPPPLPIKNGLANHDSLITIHSQQANQEITSEHIAIVQPMFRFFNGSVSFCRMLRIAEFSAPPSLLWDETGGRGRTSGSQAGNPVSRAEAPLGQRWFGLNWREETAPRREEMEEMTGRQGDGEMMTGRDGDGDRGLRTPEVVSRQLFLLCTYGDMFRDVDAFCFWLESSLNSLCFNYWPSDVSHLNKE